MWAGRKCRKSVTWGNFLPLLRVIPWIYSPPSMLTRHHQDCYMLRIGNPNTNGLILWDCMLGGGRSKYTSSLGILHFQSTRRGAKKNPFINEMKRGPPKKMAENRGVNGKWGEITPGGYFTSFVTCGDSGISSLHEFKWYSGETKSTMLFFAWYHGSDYGWGWGVFQHLSPH